MTATPTAASPKGPPELVSVVIPVRDGEAHLEAQLAALAHQTYVGEWELIVADNGSTDRTLHILEEWQEHLPHLRVVDASGRPGSAYARNRGVASAQGELICFCDADDVVDRSWLEQLIASATDADIVGGRLEIESLNDVRARRWRGHQMVDWAPDEELQFAPTSNMAVWRGVYEELGGLDEAYLKSHDVEFGVRARRAGKSIRFASTAVVHYRYRSTLRGIARQAYRGGKALAQTVADHPDVIGRRSVPEAIRAWLWVAIRVPYLLHPTRRGVIVNRAAHLAGRLVGSVQHRVRGW